jgi:HD-GYP domain-containing protein (c-di-GMP phosphodiesterase class II)
MAKAKSYAVDPQLTRLLDIMYKEVKSFADAQSENLKKLTRIGIALSAEQNINILLEMILTSARDITNADAGTIYTVDDANKELIFEVVQNDTLGTKMGGSSKRGVVLPPVPLGKNGQPNYSNVSSYCAISGKTINIPDVYDAKDFDFTGPRNYDQQTGYRSKSMLVMPLKNHENDVIGVLQLLNATVSESKEVIPFSEDYIELVSALASQAAIALENAQLISDLKNLFDSFIKGIATAIDAKSPYTGGHIRRVTELTMKIARLINEVEEGPLADIELTDDELEELRIASWLHDVGKITTPEHVADKAYKLETIFNRIDLIKTRFELIMKEREIKYLKDRIEWMQNKNSDEAALKKLETSYQNDLKILKEEEKFLEKCNLPNEFLEDEKVERLIQIGEKLYTENGSLNKYLSKDELENLLIRKGTLTEKERKIIENHVVMSMKILKNLPFPKKLARVPEYAGGHHERLDGTGYPNGLKGDQLPLQARIMAIADIFESLTAKDRPYKKPMKLSQTTKILYELGDQNKIDRDILDAFIKSGLYKQYAEKELNPEQNDQELDLD